MASPFVAKVCLGGFAACTVVVGGSYWALTGKEEKHSFRKEFANALIGKNDSAIWDKKLELLKVAESTPKHKNLKDAKSKVTNQAQEAKKILQNTCDEIVNSEYTGPSGDNYLDFKSFCSINNKDKVTNWLDEGSRNARLKELKEGSGSLTSDFERLKNSITNAGSPTDTNRTDLTNLCNSLGSEIFKGDTSVEHLNVSAYCKKTT